jgi:hypothetical protein
MIIPTLIDDYNEEDLPWLIEGFLCPTLTVISAQPSTVSQHLLDILQLHLLTEHLWWDGK